MSQIRRRIKELMRKPKENTERVEHENTRYTKRTRTWKINVCVFTQAVNRVGCAGTDPVPIFHCHPPRTLVKKVCLHPSGGQASRSGAHPGGSDW
jgi:hypothetical protein